MNKQVKNILLTRNFLILVAAVMGIAVLTASLAWNRHQVDKTIMALAENEARAYFEKDVVYRHWAAMHGGVYVPASETTPPNPYLNHLPDRDATTPSGKELTLVNPAYMTRQVHELGLELYGMQGHITSLNPLRPENAPDQWEERALLSFEQGAGRFSSVETLGGRQYLRFMKPLVTRESCLGCHADQGYDIGDIHGGISVSVAWEPYLSQAGTQKTNLALAHAFIGVLGLLGLWTGQRLLSGAELKLLESRAQKAATLHSIGDGVVSCDKGGRIQDMNPAAENLTGWTLDEALDRPLEEVFNIVALKDHGKEQNPVSRVLQQGRAVAQDAYSVLISRNGGKITIKMSCSPIRDNLDGITGAVLVFRDGAREHTANLLTRKRLELYEYAAVHSLDELMTKVLDDAEEFVDSFIGFFHFVEKDQKTLSLQRWSTRSLQELCHMPGNKMHYSIDQAGVWVQAALEKKPVIHNDYESMPDKKGLPEGHARVIREIVVPVIRDNKVVAIMGLGNKPADYDEKDVEVISFFADVTWDLVEQKRTQEALQNSITEKKQAQEELQRNARNLEIKNAELDAARIKAQAANRAKSEFLANMSHEVRTPMNAVMGMSSLLLDTELTSKQKEYALSIQRNSEFLLNLISDILDISRMESEKLFLDIAEFSLQSFLDQLASDFQAKARKKNLEFTFHPGPGLDLIVSGDEKRLRQILDNLLDNAVKFTPRGYVEFSAQTHEEEKNPHSGVQDMVTLDFEVRDTGIGISADKLNHIFEKFSQVDSSSVREFGGTGLGLAIAGQLADIMGGDIRVASKPGQGTSFYFTVSMPGERTNERQSRPEGSRPQVPAASGFKADYTKSGSTLHLAQTAALARETADLVDNNLDLAWNKMQEILALPLPQDLRVHAQKAAALLQAFETDQASRELEALAAGIETRQSKDRAPGRFE